MIFSLLKEDKTVKIRITTIIVNGYQMFQEIASKEFQVIFFLVSIIHGKNKLTSSVILENNTIFQEKLKTKLLNQKRLKILIILCFIFLSFSLSL